MSEVSLSAEHARELLSGVDAYLDIVESWTEDFSDGRSLPDRYDELVRARHALADALQRDA